MPNLVSASGVSVFSLTRTSISFSSSKNLLSKFCSPELRNQQLPTRVLRLEHFSTNKTPKPAPPCYFRPLSGLIARGLGMIGGELGAMTRSTVIATEAEFLPPGNNVIPSLARANFNFRLLPSETLNAIQYTLM